MIGVGMFMSYSGIMRHRNVVIPPLDVMIVCHSIVAIII